MSVCHHVSEELIAEYAAGALDEGWSLAIATHLSLCGDCRGAAADFDAIGGALLTALDVAPVHADALAACLARLDDGPPAPAADANVAARCPVLPSPLASYAGGGLGAVRWRSVGGGVKQCKLPVKGAASARLLWIPPGVAVPEHGHGGMELTLVLAGSFSDGAAAFHRGDIQEADVVVEHTPVSGPDEVCICLAVTDAPLRFKRFLPRVVQRFAHI